MRNTSSKDNLDYMDVVAIANSARLQYTDGLPHVMNLTCPVYTPANVVENVRILAVIKYMKSR